MTKKERTIPVVLSVYKTRRVQPGQKTSAESRQTKQQAADEHAHRGPRRKNMLNTLHGAPETQLAGRQAFWPGILLSRSGPASLFQTKAKQERAQETR